MTESLTNPDNEIHLIIDFESIGLDDFIQLFDAARSLVVRGLIAFLKRSDSEENRRALSRLGQSYQKFAEQRFFAINGFHEIYFDRAWRYGFEFRDENEPPFFDEWTRYIARGDRLEIQQITLGSYDFGVYVAGLLHLFFDSYSPLNYSMTKDFTNQLVHFIRERIARPKPPGHLESVPEIVESLADNPRIKKFEVRASVESVDVKAEFQVRRRGR